MDPLPRENANTTTEMYPHPRKKQQQKQNMLKILHVSTFALIHVTYV